MKKLLKYGPKSRTKKNLFKSVFIRRYSSVSGSDRAGLTLFPSVRRLFIEYGLNDSNIRGSGIRGKILKGDVLSFIAKNKVFPLDNSVLSKNIQTNIKESNEVKAKVLESKPVESKKSVKDTGLQFVDIPNSNMRMVIAKRLTLSKKENPHAYATCEVNIDKILGLRKELNVGDVKLSINDFLIKAIAVSLDTIKDVNVTISNNKVTRQNTVDISVAVAIEGGLITPIIFNANKKSLLEINSNVKDLSALAKKGALKPEQYQGGSFSISNLGMFGVDYFSAVINPPQAAIIAVGNKQDKLTLNDGKLKSESYLILQLCYNAAAFEEDKAGQFLEKLKSVIQNPYQLM